METLGETPREYEETEEQIFESSDLFQKVVWQKERTGEASALFSDFDGTLFSGDISETAELVKTAREKDVPIIAVTGRGALALKEVIDDLVADYNGQHPGEDLEEINFDAIIGAVGTEIMVATLRDGKIEYRKDEEYERQMIEQGFVRPELAHKVAEAIDDLAETQPEIAANYQGEFATVEKEYLNGNQDAEVQPFKISLGFYASSPEELDFVTKYFEDRFPSQRVVICESIGYNSRLEAGDSKKKYCLDVLPVTKAEAVDYLAKKIGVSKGLVAGDSGNDSTMLTDSEKLQAVLVGGHKAEARATIDQAIIDDPDRRGRKFQRIASGDGGSKRVYIGEGDKVGPDSILHVAEAYERAATIKAIREAKKTENKPE